MGSVPPELSLDFRPTFVPKSISDFLGEVSRIGDVSERTSKLEDFVKRLEEELRKIDAFKRELPLCMALLNDAIQALKESIQCAAPNEVQVQPLLEEFIPLKKDCDRSEENEKEKDYRDKKNWMSSFQLWNSDDHPSTDCTKHSNKSETKGSEEAGKLGREEDPIQSCKTRAEGVGFLPFRAYSGFPFANKEEREEFPVHGLSLLTPGIKNPREESNSNGSRNDCSRSVSSSAPTANIRSVTQQPQHQTARKQRRCWSPELHRRFVNALQQLGGSQAATPKQIRELMQVDGLTNDEVKSHLQKYRLHTRRLPAKNASATPTNQSVVVLGGLWMPQDQYGESSKASSSQSGSPQGPLQLTGNTGGTSTTGGDIMEDDEDAKSEGYSWKSHIQKPGKIIV